jgi:hypothetical protein
VRLVRRHRDRLAGGPPGRREAGAGDEWIQVVGMLDADRRIE